MREIDNKENRTMAFAETFGFVVWMTIWIIAFVSVAFVVATVRMIIQMIIVQVRRIVS